MSDPTRRRLFADQLGPHFLDSPRQPALLIESKAVFRRRVFHRQKAHLVLSALRHRAAAPDTRLIRAETYTEALRQVDEPVSVCHPTSRAARGLVHRLDVEVPPPRGFVTSPPDFVAWAGWPHEAADGGLLPGRPAAARHPDGRAGAGRWPVEFGRREPRAATAHRDAGRAAAAGDHRGRRRRRGPRRPGPVAA